MAKQITWVLGVVLTIVGIWGYVTSPNLILNIFEVDGLHNFIHLASGIVGILAGLGGDKYAKMYLQVFGVIYAVVFLVGIFTPGTGKILGLFVSNTADDILHLIIAAVALYGGFGKGKAMSMGGGAPTPTVP